MKKEEIPFVISKEVFGPDFGKDRDIKGIDVFNLKTI